VRPHDYTRLETPAGATVFAHGRDPNFPGWTDTLQLNYGNPQLQQAMIGELMKVAAMCDGVRCDMAMLALPEVFARTWGIRAEPFWPRAIQAVRARYPGFTFMAEAYWDLEWALQGQALQQQGFDVTYDKRLYDRLRGLEARPVREHFWAAPDYQDRSARFLENHDEPRAAAVFPLDAHRAAALLAFLCPGLRFFHQGQLQGWQKKIPVQLCRAPEQPANHQIEAFYGRLLELLRQDPPRNGAWRLLECAPAWEGNPTWDSTIAFAWRGQDSQRWLVVVNYAPHPSQCYLLLPFSEWAGASLHLNDLLSVSSYSREGDDLLGRGLYLDLPPWGYHVFEVVKGE
jgi:glycosidase